MSRPRLPVDIPLMIYCMTELERDLQPLPRAHSDRDTVDRMRQRWFPDDEKPTSNLRTLYLKGCHLVRSDAAARSQVDYMLGEARKRRLSFGDRADPILLMFASDELEMSVLRRKVHAQDLEIARIDEVTSALQELRTLLLAEMSTH